MSKFSGVVLRLVMQEDEEGRDGKSKVLRTSKWMMRDMQGRCRKEGFCLTGCAAYQGDDDWKKKKEKKERLTQEGGAKD